MYYIVVDVKLAALSLLVLRYYNASVFTAWYVYALWGRSIQLQAHEQDCVPKCPNNNTVLLVNTMAWRPLMLMYIFYLNLRMHLSTNIELLST